MHWWEGDLCCKRIVFITTRAGSIDPACVWGLYFRCLRSILVFLLHSIMHIIYIVIWICNNFGLRVVWTKVKRSVVPWAGAEVPGMAALSGAAWCWWSASLGCWHGFATAQEFQQSLLVPPCRAFPSPGHCNSHSCVDPIISVGEIGFKEDERQWRKWKCRSGELME